MLHPKWWLSTTGRSSCSSPRVPPPLYTPCSSVSTLPLLPGRHHVNLPQTLDFSCTPLVAGKRKSNLTFWITFPVTLSTSILLWLHFIYFRGRWNFDSMKFGYWQALQDKRKRMNICQLLISARGSVGSWISVILLILTKAYKVKILISYSRWKHGGSESNFHPDIWWLFTQGIYFIFRGHNFKTADWIGLIQAREHLLKQHKALKKWHCLMVHLNTIIL